MILWAGYFPEPCPPILKLFVQIVCAPCYQQLKFVTMTTLLLTIKFIKKGFDLESQNVILFGEGSANACYIKIASWFYITIVYFEKI